MRHYATLFDSKYLPQGLALYESLKKHSSEPFTFTVCAMDDECDETLKRLALPHVGIYHVDFLSLSRLKNTRTVQEFCWTCASIFTHWLMSPNGDPELTYLDADTFFFSDPEQIFTEIGGKSIGIVPHRFPLHRKQMEANGRFNVSWVTFKGPLGSKCLQRWAEQCREKCSATEGCGDQKYLDSWPYDYPGEVCEIQNIGVGAAPWNLSQYVVTADDSKVQLRVYSQLGGVPLVFYHFHEYLHNKRLTNYKLRQEDRELIYAPYIKAVDAAQRKIEALSVTA